MAQKHVDQNTQGKSTYTKISHWKCTQEMTWVHVNKNMHLVMYYIKNYATLHVVYITDPHRETLMLFQFKICAIYSNFGSIHPFLCLWRRFSHTRLVALEEFIKVHFEILTCYYTWWHISVDITTKNISKFSLDSDFVPGCDVW